jgi:hypothetical protein
MKANAIDNNKLKGNKGLLDLHHSTNLFDLSVLGTIAFFMVWHATFDRIF